MRDRDREIAVKFNILDKCQSLESQLLGLPYVYEAEFDLSGFIDDLDEINILVGYDLPPNTQDYFLVRRSIKMGIIKALLENHLYPTGDRVEDYGEHFYFVRKIDDTWKVGESNE